MNSLEGSVWTTACFARLFSVRIGSVVVARMVLRWFLYAWASPWTLVAIAIGLLLGGRFARVGGVVEIHGRRIANVLQRFIIPVLAITVGHVVFGQSQAALEITRKHERVHVRQYERWGIAFVPAYLLISAYLYLRGRDGYRENPFEIEAYAVDDPSRSRVSATGRPF
jgi:hypothetical protein